jgi:hypothetical protein
MPEARLNVIIDPSGAETGGRIVSRVIQDQIALAGRLDAILKEMEETRTSTSKQSAEASKMAEAQMARFNAIAGQAPRAVNAFAQSVSTASVAANTASQNLTLASHEIINMQYQMNDMAVMLASGQNPFVMIMQQGMQIGQIFTARGTGLRDSLALVGQGFITFLTNPVNLAVISLASLAGAVTFLWSVMSGDDAKTSKDMMSDFNDSLGEIKEQFEGVKIAVEEYNKTLGNLNIAEATLISNSRQMQDNLDAEIKKLSDRATILAGGGFRVDLGGEISTVIPNISSGGAIGTEALASEGIQQIARLVDKMQEGLMTVERFREAMSLILLSENVPEDVKEVANEFLIASDEAGKLAAKIGEAEAAVNGLSKAVYDIPSFRFDNKPLSRDEIETGGLTTTEKLARDLKDQAEIISPRKRKEPKTDAQRLREQMEQTIRNEQEAIANLNDSMRTELDLIGATNLEKQKANATARLGLSATDEQIAKTEELVEALYRQNQAYNDLITAQNFMAQTAYNAFESIVTGSDTAEKALQKLVAQLASAFLQSALLGTGPLAGISGLSSPTSGAVGGLLGALFGGFRAEGGPVTAGKSYIVGERGRELFTPKTNGFIMPNEQMRGSKSSEAVVFNIDARGAQLGVADEIKKALTDYDRRSLARHIDNTRRMSKNRV